MALKLKPKGTTYSTANSGGATPSRFTDGLLARENMSSQQSAFVNNMHKDPELTLATAIGGLLGSIVGNTVNENGIRKGTESAMDMLDAMKSGYNPERSVTVGDNTVNAVDVMTPAPGIGFMEGYMSKYAQDENPKQLNKDLNRITDALSLNGNQMFANATPDQIRAMIKRQAMAEGRSSQQADRILENVNPEIDSAYKSYMDESDAANYTAALGYMQQGRYADAMNIVPKINNPKLVSALDTYGRYLDSEKTYQLKRDALALRSGGNKSGGNSVVAGDDSRIISTYQPKYQEWWSKLPKSGDFSGTMFKDDQTGKDVLKQDVYRDQVNWLEGRVNLDDKERVNNEINTIYGNLTDAINANDSKKFHTVLANEHVQRLLDNDEFNEQLRRKLYDAGYLHNVSEKWNEAFTRNAAIDNGLKRYETSTLEEQQQARRSENSARGKAYSAYAKQHRALTAEEKQAALDYANEHWQEFL